MNSNKKRYSYWQDGAQDKKVQEHMDLTFASWNASSTKKMLQDWNAEMQ